MGRLAFVFPGQGSQSVGMGVALLSAWPQAAAVLADADAVLGEPLTRLIADGPAETLDRTEHAQPALLATSIALLRALQLRATDEGAVLRPAFAAGHSMGQYSALVAAGSISLADGLRLVRERGRLMQSSGEGRPGAMAAIIGLDEEQLPTLLERAAGHGTLTLANRNAPGQVVVSGERPAVEAAADIAKDLGARRVIVLPVSVAAHSPLMADAAIGMRAALAGVAIRGSVAAAARQCRWSPAARRGGCARGARRPPDDRGRLGRRRRARWPRRASTRSSRSAPGAC